MKAKPFQDCRSYVLKSQNIGEPVEVDDFDLLQSLRYDTDTPFKHPNVPMQVLEDAKVPPLGIEDLHKQGLTGEGVNVAIIDQPMLPHPEYADQIAANETFDAGHREPRYDDKNASAHGNAVASLLVGKTIGVAPKAKLYFAGDASSHLKNNKIDAKAYADALLWVVEKNKTLPEKDKIKFVSVSATPESSFFANSQSWEKAVRVAEQNGIVVVQCGKKRGFVDACYINPKTHKIEKGWPIWSYLKRKAYAFARRGGKKVFVPTSYRTVVDKENYTYCGNGGLSWGIPYAVGLLAIGQQIAPDLSAKELKEIFVASSGKDNIVLPQNFVKMVREKSKASNSVKYPKKEMKTDSNKVEKSQKIEEKEVKKAEQSKQISNRAKEMTK